jgi:hypothetical protein
MRRAWDHPKVFGRKFWKGPSHLRGSRTQKKYQRKSYGTRLGDTGSLAHGGLTCSQPYICSIGKKGPRGPIQAWGDSAGFPA